MGHITVGNESSTPTELDDEDQGAGQPVVFLHGTANEILPIDATARRFRLPDRSVSAPTRRPAPKAVRDRVSSPQVARGARSPGADTSNPVRIDRIGTDRIEVSIRAVHDRTEVLALVERLDQLMEAGVGAIDVSFDTVSSCRPIGAAGSSRPSATSRRRSDRSEP